jgi:hypothetical protein
MKKAAARDVAMLFTIFTFRLHSFIPSAFILRLIMLTHIVVWKYRSEVESAIREEHIGLLRNLASLISEVQSLAVGPDVLHLARSYDTGLVAVFQDRGALDAYTIHPEHVKVAEFGRIISEHVASVDFEG